MTYIEPSLIRDFYDREINYKLRYVWLRMRTRGWQLIARDDEAKAPSKAVMVGRFTTLASPKQFAEDVQATAGEMVRAAA